MFLSLSSNFGISKTFTPAVAETPGEEAKVKADLIGQARDFLNEGLAKVLPVEADMTRRGDRRSLRAVESAHAVFEVRLT